jgi:hypothetical protein
MRRFVVFLHVIVLIQYCLITAFVLSVSPNQTQHVEPTKWYRTFLDHTPDWFVAAFTGLLVYVTYRLVNSTNRLWEAGHRAERPHVFIAKLEGEDLERVDGTPGHNGITVRWAFQNSGKTPAFVTEASVIARAYDSLPPEPNYEQAHLAAVNERWIIPPGAGLQAGGFVIGMNLSAADKDLIWQERKRV